MFFFVRYFNVLKFTPLWWRRFSILISSLKIILYIACYRDDDDYYFWKIFRVLYSAFDFVAFILLYLFFFFTSFGREEIWFVSAHFNTKNTVWDENCLIFFLYGWVMRIWDFQLYILLYCILFFGFPLFFVFLCATCKVVSIFW